MCGNWKEAMEVGKEKFREREVEWNMEEVINCSSCIARGNGEKRVRVYLYMMVDVEVIQ
jgi:hypothetical protein